MLYCPRDGVRQLPSIFLLDLQNAKRFYDTYVFIHFTVYDLVLIVKV
jgi:hypothetical protein